MFVEILSVHVMPFLLKVLSPNPLCFLLEEQNLSAQKGTLPKSVTVKTSWTSWDLSMEPKSPLFFGGRPEIPTLGPAIKLNGSMERVWIYHRNQGYVHGSGLILYTMQYIHVFSIHHEWWGSFLGDQFSPHLPFASSPVEMCLFEMPGFRPNGFGSL